MTTLAVHPVGYARAAEALGDEVSIHLVTTGERLAEALSSCYGMAGTDDIGASWAMSYDAASASATATLRDLVSAAFCLAGLLEQSGINYAGAEAAGVPGETAPESASRWNAATAPALPAPPSAAGRGIPQPSGWSMLAHLIGRLWPDGHQDVLHHAADAWRAAGDGVRALVPALERAIGEVREQRAPEVADAITVLAGYRDQLGSFAQQCTAISDSCAAYAHHLDQAHHHIIRECVEFVDLSIAAEAAGGLLAAFTVGISEIAAQGVVAAAAVRAAEAIKSAISALEAMAIGVAGELDAAAVRLAEITRDMRPTLARTVQQAEIVRPGVAGQVAPIRSGGALGRLESYVDDWFQVGPASVTWGNLRLLFRHFRDHGADFGYASAEDYARGAAAFRLRAMRERLPAKANRSTVRYYDPRTNTFGSYRLDGRTRTFFRPKAGAKYWADQPGRQP